MKTKWKAFAVVEKDKEYLAIVSSLKLKSFWNNLKFMKFGMAIQKQLTKTKGIIGYSMSMEPFSRKYGTLSVWASEEDLVRFTEELPHRLAMDEMKQCLESRAIYKRWKIKSAKIPPDWNSAVKRLKD